MKQSQSIEREEFNEVLASLDAIHALRRQGPVESRLGQDSEDGRKDVRYDLGIYVHQAENLPRTEDIAQKVCAVGLIILLCAAMILFMLAAFKVIPFAVPLVASFFFLFCSFITRSESPNEN
jgi:hypothetical protein